MVELIAYGILLAAWLRSCKSWVHAEHTHRVGFSKALLDATFDHGFSKALLDATFDHVMLSNTFQESRDLSKLPAKLQALEAQQHLVELDYETELNFDEGQIRLTGWKVVEGHRLEIKEKFGPSHG